MYKSFKDPIYGYISIEKEIVKGIVDTAAFQRLRNVIQTSYAPLYSSAVHNRFVHSLGVYHLGNIVSRTIETMFQNEEGWDLSRCLFVFKLACLLHDVGHAPFSHTGEEYYLDNGSRDELHEEIIRLTGDENLRAEIASKDYKAAPHELMSVIIALDTFPKYFTADWERSFFARCIIGYSYVKNVDLWHSFLNCLISFLNSSVIDVDKLDYLIRDAYITGFDTINIDYIRLLRSVRIQQQTDLQTDFTAHHVVYTKNAISVIENVVYAHDAERKWIQNHPVVQYEGYLLKNIMAGVNRTYGNPNIFSKEMLTFQGDDLKNGFHISLLCDADMIFLMKNMQVTSDIMEYFFRTERKHPLWKSESEYKAFFNPSFTKELFAILECSMEQLIKYVNKLGMPSIINEQVLKRCDEDIEKCECLIEENSDKKYVKMLQQKKKMREWIMAFKEFAKEQEIAFNFVMIQANQFNSGFSKQGFEELEIVFPNMNKPVYFKTVTNVLTANKSAGNRFFYLFFDRKEKQKINIFCLVDKLNKLAKDATR